ncbi:MAG: periplasmic heavy metal sensor [Pseudorhodobacter sp.]|nr:MAG: periplasmic heavy metal sensor [Pseudorhodobacter sp.]
MAETDLEKPKSSKGLRIALALSVALNLAVLGLVAGAILRDGPGMRAAMVRDLGFGPYTEALSPEDRKALRRALFEKAPDIRENRRKMREDTQALLALLRNDPFDADAFHARMEAQHERMEDQLRLGQDLLQDFITAMPAPERRAFADRLEAGLRHHKDHDEKDRNGKDGGKDD